MKSSVSVVMICGVMLAASHFGDSRSTGSAFATPSSGITQVPVASGVFDPFHVSRKFDGWKALLKVDELTTIAYQSSTAIPGGSTGWHSHPGPVFITVTAGTVTVYNAEDPACTPRVFTAGEGLVEPETVHILRNEGTVEAKWTSANIRPIDQPARFDEPAPATCPF